MEPKLLTLPSPSAHVFNKAVDSTIARTQALSADRGSAYQDTWALEHQNFTFMEHVLRLVGVEPPDESWLRLMKLAALVDTKDDRMLGEWKTDHVDDGINYRAAFADLMEQYVNSFKDYVA